MPGVWQTSSGQEEEWEFPGVDWAEAFVQEVRVLQVQPLEEQGVSQGVREDKDQGQGARDWLEYAGSLTLKFI